MGLPIWGRRSRSPAWACRAISITFPDPATHLSLYLAVFGGLIALAAARRVPVLRTLVSLASWAILAGLLVLLVNQRAAFDPYLSKLTGALNLDRQTVEGRETRVRVSPDGHYWVRATIDGTSHRLLVDSGATVTTLSVALAREAGLETTQGPFPVILHTANGNVTAATATVREMRLGNIIARDLPVVVAPAMGDMNVVGMNFLSRLKGWRVEEGVLVLTPHHPQEASRG